MGKQFWRFTLDDGNVIKAKITDDDWLVSFHNRNIALKPGDSLHIKGIVKPFMMKIIP